MARAIFRVLSNRYVCAILLGGVLGGILGFASAQDTASGSLDPVCAAHCAANGNEAAFCGQVCWVLNADVAARSYPVNWDCYTSCRERGGRPRDCMPVCRKR